MWHQPPEPIRLTGEQRRLPFSTELGASPRSHGRVVPTWNYAVVHVRGPLTFFGDPVRLRAIVDRLTERHEGKRAAPWKTTDAPERFIASQLAAIIGFELLVSSIEGKYKLSQNREPADRAGVVEGLAGTAVGDMMAPESR